MTKESRIPTNLRTLLILEVMAKSDRALTPTEINADIGLPKQTVHRLCGTLEKEGYLERIAGGKRLQPGRRLALLSSGLLQSARFQVARHQVLVDVAAQVKEAVNYVVAQDTGMHYLDRVDTDWPFRIQLPIGTDVPFHCTASGKTYMASLTPSARRAFVASLDLKPHTDATHTSVEELLADLKTIAKRGFALDQQEFMEGMVAISVPVTDPNGRFVAALAFHGPSQRLSTESAIAQKEVLLDGARKLQDVMFA